MSDDKDIMAPKGLAVEISANAIAQIIIQQCHCGVGRAEKAADLIIDYMTSTLIEQGAIDVTTQGPQQ